MFLNAGDKVKIREDLREGMGVVKEQLEYAGKIQEVECLAGYGVVLKNNPFSWKQTDLIKVGD